MKGLYVVLAIMALGLTGCLQPNAGFQRVGGQALTHFVVVEPARAADPGIYEAAVSRVCRGQSLHCVVLFWTDSTLAARGLPMTDAEASAVVARFRLHRPTASNGFRCHPFGRPEERCTTPGEPTESSVYPREPQRTRELAGGDD